jgi:hypothetical protein
MSVRSLNMVVAIRRKSGADFCFRQRVAFLGVSRHPRDLFGIIVSDFQRRIASRRLVSTNVPGRRAGSTRNPRDLRFKEHD